PSLHSLPTRRSSDLVLFGSSGVLVQEGNLQRAGPEDQRDGSPQLPLPMDDDLPLDRRRPHRAGGDCRRGPRDRSTTTPGPRSSRHVSAAAAPGDATAAVVAPQPLDRRALVRNTWPAVPMRRSPSPWYRSRSRPSSSPGPRRRSLRLPCTASPSPP